MISERVKGHLLIFTANLIFGINYTISKWILAEHLTPEFHTLLRMVVACVLFWGISYFLPKEKLSLKELGVLFLCSLGGIAGNQALFTQGLSMTSPIDASVITTGTPIIVMLLAAVFLREPITWKKTLGVLLGASGAIWLVLQSAPQSGGNASAESSSSLAGNLFIFGSSLIYATYFVFSKPLSVKYQAVTMMKWMFLFAVFTVAPLTVPAMLRPNGILLAPLTFEAVAAITYVCVGATFLAYMLIPMAVRRIRPTSASMYNYVQPMVACALAIVVAQDVFSWSKLLAAVIIFLGVYLVTQSKARRDLSAPK